ncbi:MAG: hypothetical protein ABIH08_07665 [Candidatus Omnitrophota bacterium]
MKIGKAALAGIVVGILHFIWGGVTCGWLFSWVYKIEPTCIWKLPQDIPFMLAAISGIVFAILLALVYAIIYKSLPGKGITKGLWYGLFTWLVGALPGNFSLGLYTTMASQVIVYWVIIFLITSLWSGLAIAAIYGKQE